MNVRLLAAPAVLLLLSTSALAQESSIPDTDATLATTATAASTLAATATPPSVTPSASPSASAAAASSAAGFVDTSKDYRIGPEDVLDILVWKQENLSRTVPVRPDGKVSIPLVNDIVAAGLTPTELRQQLTERLSEYVPSPEVSVIVKEVHSVKVAVLGAVKMPGHYEVKAPSTVLELIARAQGFTEFADRNRIVVIRQNGSTTTRVQFNYKKVAEGNDQENFSVKPGDIIVVP
jgi:polysaccharide export outer membrane protein